MSVIDAERLFDRSKQWVRFVPNKAALRVSEIQDGDNMVVVSTVELPEHVETDHGLATHETVIFHGPFSGSHWYYESEQQAIDGHQQITAIVQARLAG